MLAGSLRDEKAQAFDGAALGTSARPIESQDSRRENILNRRGIFAGRGGEQGPGAGTCVRDAAHLGGGERIFQVGRGGA
jgi:hypothetical protein